MSGQALRLVPAPGADPLPAAAAVANPLDRPPLSWRWIGAAGLVLALHAATLLLLMRPARVPPPPGAEPALMVQLAPPDPAPEPRPEPEPAPRPEAAPAPAPTPTPEAAQRLPETAKPEPPPEPPPPEPEPEAAAETLPEPPPLPPPPVAPARPVVPLPPRPVAKPARVAKPPAQVQPATAAPAIREAPLAPVAQPPAPSAGQAGSPSWQARLLAHLNRFKRYPPAAQMRRQEGTATVGFRLMPDGSAQAVRLVTPTGTASLDEEATALLARAQPLPRPDNTDQPIELVVPIQFQMR